MKQNETRMVEDSDAMRTIKLKKKKLGSSFPKRSKVHSSIETNNNKKILMWEEEVTDVLIYC